MICKNCGIEIADKAIVCYRCGTATAASVRKPVEIRRRRGPIVPIVILVVLALLALFFGYEYHVFGLELTLSVGPADAPNSVSSASSAAPAFVGPASGALIHFPAVHA